MKNKGLFFTSLIGGAILGSAITCALKSSKGVELRRRAHEKIIHELQHLRAHVSGSCHCTQTGDCDMPMGGEAQSKEE